MEVRSFARLFVIFFFVFAGQLYAQGTAKTNEWRGLTLGYSSTADAIERFGDPAAELIRQKYRPLRFEEWFDVETRDFRVLRYEGPREIKGFSDVKLYFREDTLLAIRLEPYKLKAFALERAYDAEFKYLEDEVAEILIPRPVGRGRGRPYPKSYPMFYYLMNATEEAYAFAAIDNNSVEEILGNGSGSRGSLPGRVSKLDLISTKLESSDGSDLLK